jgi:hypothetical protein
MPDEPGIERNEEISVEPELASCREFLIGLKKWSAAVIAGAVLGSAPSPVEAASAAGWINSRGGWVNGAAWANRGAAWVNGAAAWVNAAVGGGGGWVNGRGYGGGAWVNR